MAAAVLGAKKASNKRKSCGFSTTIKSLPTELLSEVLARVASASVADLHRAKASCKDFLNVANSDNYIHQHASMEKFPLVAWFTNDKESSFLKRCRQSGNLESLYREGMMQYLSTTWKVKAGLENLKEAAGKGHTQAKYVYGMILVCSGDDGLRKEGLEVLRCLRMAKCVRRCRKRVESFIRSMWVRNRGAFQNRGALCGSKACKGRLQVSIIKGVWPSLNDEEDEDIACDGCRWDYELSLVSKMSPLWN